MPTIDDLRETLTAREAYAGDPDVVLRRVLAAPTRSRRLAPLAAAAAVVLIGSVAAALAVSHDGRSGTSPGGADPSAWMSAGVSQPVSAPPASTAPPGASAALTWPFSVDPVPGWTVRRTSYTPVEQIGSFTGAHGWYATLEVHPPGIAGPDVSRGEQVTINGRPGWVIPDAANPAYPRLAWRYAPDSWAVLEVTPGTEDPGHAASRTDELRLARAVRFGPAARPDRVLVPFRMRLPSDLAAQAMGLLGSGACVGYGTGGYPERGVAVQTADLGTVLTVCRVPAGTDTSGYRSTDDRIVYRSLPDGTVLEVALNVNHLDAFSVADLQQLAADADTGPRLGAPSTWLPLG